MEQLVIKLDASEFEGFESTAEYFNYMARTTKDESGRLVKLQVQAMELDYSPSHYSQKLNQINNSKITLDDADEHTNTYGDTRWIEFAYFKHVISKKKNREELIRLREEIDRQLAEEA